MWTRRKWDRFLLTWMCFSLRTLIITSLYIICYFLASSDSWERMASIFSFVVLLHQILSVWRLKFIPIILDWLLVIGEIITWFCLGFHTWSSDRWSVPSLVILVGSLYVQIIALFALFCIRSTMLVRQLGPGLCLPFDLLSLDTISINQNTNSSIEHGRQWSRTPPEYLELDALVKESRRLFLERTLLKERLRVIFGRVLWKSRSSNEPAIFRTLRGFMATIIFLGLFIFAVFVLVVQPIGETAVVPMKTFSSVDLPFGFQADNPTWNLVVVVDRDIMRRQHINITLLNDAIQVSPLWENYDQSDPLCGFDQYPPLDEKPACGFVPNEGSVFNEHSLPSNTPGAVEVQFLRYFCPSRCDGPMSWLDFVRTPASLTVPDLLVTVNFASLGISPLSGTVGGLRNNALGVVVALTNFTHGVLQVSSPTMVFPGMHALGQVGYDIRSLITNSRLASLGPITTSRTFLRGTISDLIQDPTPPSSDNTTASLRLYVANDPSDWYFFEDNREKSVLAGLAAVGGIWTAVSGIFTILFGGTLALVFWGRKPLSVFGLSYSFWEDKLREEWRGEFQGSQVSQHGLSERDLMMIKLLREHMIDLGPLEDIDAETSANRR